MASFLKNVGRIFGLGSGEKPQSKDASQLPTQNLMDYAPGFKGLFGRTEKRSMGEGLGIDPNLLQRSTSALAAQRRAGLEGETIPLINAQATGKGLGRSILPIRQASYASQAAERDIESRLADLTLANEQEKIRQRELADQSLYGMGIADVGQQNVWRGAQGAEFDRIQGLRSARDTEQQAGLGRLVGTGLGALAGGFGVIPGLDAGLGSAVLGGLTGLTGGSFSGFQKTPLFGTEVPTSGGMTQPTSASRVPGTVNIGGYDLDMEDALKLKQLLGL